MRAHRTMAKRLALSVPVLLPSFAAIAQDTAPAPSADPIGTLMIFTLGAALLIGIVLMGLFLRKRSNREAMRRLNDE